MTTIHVSEENWKKLNQFKMLGESMDDVVSRLLEQSTDQVKKIYDERDINIILEEFVEMQLGIDEIIEQSRISLSKGINN